LKAVSAFCTNFNQKLQRMFLIFITILQLVESQQFDNNSDDKKRLPTRLKISRKYPSEFNKKKCMTNCYKFYSFTI
jgi:hypothetical protein